MGSAVGIIMGQMLGASRSREEILDHNRKLLALSTVSGGVFGILMAAAAIPFPRIYNTTESVQQLAAMLILLNSIALPFNSYTNATYFTLRSGGQTMVTFLFDSCFVWGFCVPLAWVLTRYVGIGIIPLFAICQATDLIKCVLGSIMIKQGKWIQNLAK
jgi:Na+-driven multidrug efflux pump